MTQAAHTGPVRVLVVDDDADSREVTAAFLETSGFVVEEFENAEAALARAESAAVRAVVTDITLPGMSGYDFARKLRADRRFTGVVLFALSGRSDATPEQARLFDRIIVKPFDPDALVRELESATGKPPLVSEPRLAVAAAVVPEDRERDERALARFLSHMTHDMRTPLTPLRAYYSQVQRLIAKGEPTTEELLAKMTRQVDRLTAMIDQLGEAARMTAHRPLLMNHDEQADLASIVRNVCDKRAAAGRGPTLRVTGAETACPVRGDARRIAQMVDALVDNALKFAATGTQVDVHVSTADGTHRVVVRDNGIGIPSDELPLVGRPFFRGSNAPSETYSGAGLGLALATEIAKAHGGTLRIESSPGVTATIAIPSA